MNNTDYPFDQARLKAYIKQTGQVVNEALDRYTSFDPEPFKLLSDSMKYSLFAGGKRVRPVLCLAGCEVVGGKAEVALPFACALEMIHTYSLIHDDLPCMDDDDLRRGRPTNHKVYGEAQALLAGNALLTLAYEISLQTAADGLVSHKTAVEVLHYISKAIGIMGVMGGQSLDILWEGDSLSEKQVEIICHHKTATLISSSVLIGAMLGGADDHQLAALREYGKAIGLAFQVADDILNVSGDAEKLGKSTGTDKERGKTTYPRLLGMDGAQKRATELLKTALSAIDSFGDQAWMLRDLAKYIVYRES